MTDQKQHPITPPPELVEKWNNLPLSTQEIIAIAWRNGADTELEATLAEVAALRGALVADRVRAARRPKPPSLKEQALQELDKVDMLWATEEFGKETLNSLDTIRRALEALPDD